MQRVRFSNTVCRFSVRLIYCCISNKHWHGEGQSTLRPDVNTPKHSVAIFSSSSVAFFTQVQEALESGRSTTFQTNSYTLVLRSNISTLVSYPINFLVTTALLLNKVYSSFV